MNLDVIPTNRNGDPVARESDDPNSDPRTLRSLLLQALEQAPIAGWMQVGPGMQRPAPDEPASIVQRIRLIDRIEKSDGEIKLSGKEEELLEKCVAAEYVIGAVMIRRAMGECDNG